jgi:hypothetical protein
VELKVLEFLNSEVLQLPSLFKVNNIKKDTSGRFVVDQRITEAPIGYQVEADRKKYEHFLL